MNRLRELWDGLGRNNQIILVVSTLGVMIALIGFVSWASTPEYVPLASNLSAADASAITDKLKEDNVPYRLSQGGQAIEVPAQQRDEVRMKIATLGLPKDSSATMGYGLLDKGGSIGETKAREDKTLLRVTEGEIGKSIMSLDQVASATVHIAPSEDSPFVSDKKDPSASVLVTLKPGESLSKENIRAVVRMTQMSYTGLTDKNITLVNQQGDLLFDGTRVGENASSDDRMQEQHQAAQDKRAELQAALDATIGPHKSVVMVNVELNNDRQQIETNEASPGAVLDQTSHTEDLTGPGSLQGGSPASVGAAANMPNPAPGAAPTTPTTYAQTKDATGHYTNTTTEKHSQPTLTHTVTNKEAGRIEKLTVSALVDKSVPPDQIASITQTLQTAVGAAPNDPTRLVSVTQIEFDRSGETKEAAAEAAARSSENISKLLATLVPLGIMLLTLVLLARALKKPALRMPGGQLALAGAGGAMTVGSLEERGVDLAIGSTVGASAGSQLAGMAGGETALNENGEPIGLIVGRHGAEDLRCHSGSVRLATGKHSAPDPLQTGHGRRPDQELG